MRETAAASATPSPANVGRGGAGGQNGARRARPRGERRTRPRLASRDFPPRGPGWRGAPAQSAPGRYRSRARDGARAGGRRPPECTRQSGSRASDDSLEKCQEQQHRHIPSRAVFRWAGGPLHPPFGFEELEQRALEPSLAGARLLAREPERRPGDLLGQTLDEAEVGEAAFVRRQPSEKPADQPRSSAARAESSGEVCSATSDCSSGASSSGTEFRASFPAERRVSTAAERAMARRKPSYGRSPSYACRTRSEKARTKVSWCAASRSSGPTRAPVVAPSARTRKPRDR